MPSARFPVRWIKRHYLISLFSMVSVLALILSACSTSANTTTTDTSTASSTPTATSPGALGLAALPGYTVTLFTHRTGSYTAPDAIVVNGNHVFIDYQNASAKDCTDTNSSNIVEYTMNGTVVKSFTVAGHTSRGSIYETMNR